MVSNNPDLAEQKFQYFDAISQGVLLSREIISEPPNVIYPETFAKKAKELIHLGLVVKILNESEMKN